MADHAIERLGGKTPLQYAKTPNMDRLAREGRCGRLMTVPEGFPPGSEVANTAILGYDLNRVYEGRGPLEAASIGYEMQEGDMAIRCNVIALENGKIKNHHGNHLTSEQGAELMRLLDDKLGNEKVKFIPGIQYRHLLVIKGGNKNIICNPPHDHPDEEWRPLLVKAAVPEAEETAELIDSLILQSQDILGNGLSIWPWSPGYRPSMTPLTTTFPEIKTGSVITAVDLIKGIGHYAGLQKIEVEGATGLFDTNYEGKAAAAIEALKKQDFVFLHIEASDEAGHDGDIDLKLRTIEDIDAKVVGPISSEVGDDVAIAVLPDHPTPVEKRIHVAEPVPFLIWHKGIDADEVETFDEVSCVSGSYGLLKGDEFIRTFMEV